MTDAIETAVADLIRLSGVTPDSALAADAVTVLARILRARKGGERGSPTHCALARWLRSAVGETDEDAILVTPTAVLVRGWGPDGRTLGRVELPAVIRAAVKLLDRPTSASAKRDARSATRRAKYAELVAKKARGNAA